MQAAVGGGLNVHYRVTRSCGQCPASSLGAAVPKVLLTECLFLARWREQWETASQKFP